VEEVDGELEITADEAAIPAAVGALPDQGNREVTNAQTIVDSQGKVLRTLVEGKDGRVLGDTSGIASAFADDLAAGKGAFQLPVSSTAFETPTLYRRIELDTSEQRTYLFENESVGKTCAVCAGPPTTPAPPGCRIVS